MTKQLSLDWIMKQRADRKALPAKSKSKHRTMGMLAKAWSIPLKTLQKILLDRYNKSMLPLQMSEEP